MVPFGEGALRFTLEEGTDRRALLASLRGVRGITDVVLAEDTGVVLFAADEARAPVSAAVSALLSATPATAAELPRDRHVVRVVYDGEDLAEIAARLGVDTDDVVALHSGREYEVAMLGFLPGFAYLRGLDPRLVLPRRARPRTRVPAGSVAIAAEYTGIYPFASPGGWSLLGRIVGRRMFGAGGAALALGDRVRFEPADPIEPSDVLAGGDAPMPPVREVHLEVVKVHGPAIVIDGGRIGHMHEGVPRGGPMVARALARSNAAAGNLMGAAAIEVYGALEVIARGGSSTVADDVRGATVLAEGESFTLATRGQTRVRYLAVGGGIDVPQVLGGHGTLLVAGLGGYAGRPLKRGDRLSSAGAATATSTTLTTPTELALPTVPTLLTLPGPDADANVIAAIARATFTISAHSDRIGTRLEGPALPPHPAEAAPERRSRPMLRGAVELTPHGLVVLGPDHPTTGGYPVVAVMPERALDELLTLPLGAKVRLAPPVEA